MKTVVCEHCGAAFRVPDKSRARVCDDCHKVVAAKRWAEHYAAEHIETRKCHDCGKPTPDYRCPECREKWMRKHHVSVVGLERDHYLEPYTEVRDDDGPR